eukprot:6210505-Pleurochrysis_carterae.AAC.1
MCVSLRMHAPTWLVADRDNASSSIHFAWMVSNNENVNSQPKMCSRYSTDTTLICNALGQAFHCKLDI